MSKIITSESRVTRDPQNDAIRTWFDLSLKPMTKAPFSARNFARQVLKDNAELFHWKEELSDLRDHRVNDGPNAHSVRFEQEFKGIPVDASEVVVNIHADGRVQSIYNNYHYDIPQELEPKKIKVKAGQARELVERLLKIYEQHEVSQPILIVYRYKRVENHPHKPAGRPTPERDNFLTAVATHVAEAWGDKRPKEGQYFLAWDLTVRTKYPTHCWRVLVDAITGGLVNVIDLLQYATGNTKVFDPNPIVTSGDIALRHNSPAATLNAERVPETIDRLDPKDSSGNLHLDGSFVHMQEEELPTIAEPVSATGDFTFPFDDNNFLAAMAYFHLDRFQHYIQTDLGLNTVANYSIPVDPQGYTGADQSHYQGLKDSLGKPLGNGYLAFGGGTVPVPSDNPVPDAADAMVILHEYGHAIQDNVNPGFDDPVSGVGEGFGDFIAAVFFDEKHKKPANTRGYMMSWDSEMGSGSWLGRRYDINNLFDGPEYTGANHTWMFEYPLGSGNWYLDNHLTGQLWCATMFELYRKLGGDSAYDWVRLAAKDLAIRLHLMANSNVPASDASAAQMGQQIEAADGNLGGWRYPNGLHKKVIYDTFCRRHLSGYPEKPVDVYINDGRIGGYGSLSGSDAFNEILFMDNYWSTQDLWVRVAPYANDADQQAGGPGDHVEPPVGSPTYLYVLVKNKGASDSGPVTVKAFHSDPTIGLVWPTDWTPADTSSLSLDNIPAGGEHVFGPFPWTPMHVGHECVFAIAECASDRAVTQDLLPTDSVAHADLVPFDNNIAQRNLYPTAAKGKMARGFWVSNPTFDRAAVRLHFDSTLPRGWTFHTNLANIEAIHLAPRERRWVEVTINQAGGSEVTDFTNPPRLSISGSINGRLIGGMSFYAAPASAFPAPLTQPPSEIKPGDLFCLNIPWKDCEIEGEIELKLRFRKK